MRAKILAACFVLIATIPAFAASNHDGRWKVDVETTVGNCPRGGETIVTIKGNRVAGLEAQGIDAWGYIDDANAFVGRFTQGEKVLRANGEVKGQSASGSWSSNTDYCGGRWSARKID